MSCHCHRLVHFHSWDIQFIVQQLPILVTGYFQEPHWLPMGLPEISRVTWQVCLCTFELLPEMKCPILYTGSVPETILDTGLIHTQCINPLITCRCKWSFNCVIKKKEWYVLSVSCESPLWMPGPYNDKSTFFHVMTRCHQATSHYLS